MKLKELKNTVVHCKTEDEYDELMRIYEEGRWIHSSGASARKHNYNPYANKKFWQCPDAKNKFNHKTTGWAGGEIISLQEFKEKQGIRTSKHPNGTVSHWQTPEEKKSITIDGHTYYHGDEASGETEMWGLIHGTMDFMEGQTTGIKFDRLGVGTTFEPLDHIKNLEWLETMFKDTHTVTEPSEDNGINVYNDHAGIPFSAKALNKLIEMTTGCRVEDGNLIPPISIPPTTMSLVDKVRTSNLNKNERERRKAGFKDSCGHWTPEAHLVALDLLCDAESDKLTEFAKEVNKECKKC